MKAGRLSTRRPAFILEAAQTKIKPRNRMDHGACCGGSGFREEKTKSVVKWEMNMKARYVCGHAAE